MNKYYIYLRVSSHMQETAMQQDIALEWLDKNEKPGNYTYKFYIDEDVSTQLKIHQRPMLQQMLDDLVPGVIVWVYKLSRIARKVGEVFTIYDLIKESKCKLISKNDPLLDNPMYLACLAGADQMAHETIRENVRDGLHSKRIRKERYSRWIPYGWDMDMTVQIELKNRKGEMEWKHGRLIPNEQEMVVVNRVKEMAVMGLTYGEITESLNEQGFTNREGKPFHKMSVLRIVKRLKENPEELVLVHR